MAYKPSDFYLNLTDLLGILAPGAVFAFLHSRELLTLVGMSRPLQPTTVWIGFFVSSYVIGHLFHGVAVPMNYVANKLRHDDDAFFSAAQAHIAMPEGLRATRANAFYEVIGYLRIRNSPALAEVEREMADYKLFRGLAVAFALHLVLVITVKPFVLPVVLSALALLLVVAFRFVFLLQRAYRRAFQLYLQVCEQQTSGPRTA